MKEVTGFVRIERSMSGAWYGWVSGVDDEGRPCSRPFKFFGSKPTQAAVTGKAAQLVAVEVASKVVEVVVGGGK